MLYSILLVFHVLVALGIIVLVLLQHGKGADAGAAFGSGASATVFGARGSASFLTRATAILATLFFITSLVLTYAVTSERSETAVTDFIPGAAESELPPAVEAQTPPGGTPAADVPETPAGSDAVPEASSDVPDVPAAPPAADAGGGERSDNP